MNSFSSHPQLTCLALLTFIAAACGEASCPSGSISVGGRCEPAPTCREGEVQDGGACIDPNDLRTDSGPQDDGGGGTGGSSGTGGIGGAGAVGGTSGAGATGGSGGSGAGGTSGIGGSGGEDDMDGGVDAGPDAEVDTRCDALDCGAYGTCEVADGAPRCACDSGHAGDLCDECEEGLQLDGTECVVVPCDAAGAPNCGDHGECSAATGEPICVCDHPFAGGTCTDCATGFAKQTDGTCEPDCGACSAHSVCNETLMTPVCECVAGYERSGASCVWSGDGTTYGVVDSELEDPSAWGGRYMSFSGGEATFTNPISGGQCDLSRLEQDLIMPSRDVSEPLVLELTSSNASAATYLVEINDSLMRLAIPGGATQALRTASVCLGDAGYGPDVHLAITPALKTDGASFSTCASLPTLMLESVQIRAATSDECPIKSSFRGTLASSAGWTLDGATISSGVLNVSAGGRASTAFEIRNSSEGAALKFETSAVTISYLDGLLFAEQRNGSRTLCMPSWSYDSVHTIEFSMAVAGTIQNLRLETDARCGSGDFDASFEGDVDAGSWSDSYVGASFTTTSKKTGLQSWANVGGASYLRAIVRFPRLSSSSDRPAFTFFHRVSGSNMESSVTLSPWAASIPFKTTSSPWTSQRICLGREWEGQPASIRMIGSARMINGAAGTPLGYVDDANALSWPAAMCP